MFPNYYPYFYRQTLDTYGAKGALNATSLSLPEILTYALQDEFLAQARYNRILGTYGYIRTFARIQSYSQDCGMRRSITWPHLKEDLHDDC